MALIDLCGQTFDKLQVVCISDHVASSGERYWVCECECGNICRARGGDLRSGLKICCPECGKKRGVEIRKNTMAAKPKLQDHRDLPARQGRGRPPKPKPPKPPEPVKPVYEAKADCTFYISECQCYALKEMLCKKKGKCGFYKPDEKKKL